MSNPSTESTPWYSRLLTAVFDYVASVSNCSTALITALKGILPLQRNVDANHSIFNDVGGDQFNHYETPPGEYGGPTEGTYTTLIDTQRSFPPQTAALVHLQLAYTPKALAQ